MSRPRPERACIAALAAFMAIGVALAGGSGTAGTDAADLPAAFSARDDLSARDLARVTAITAPTADFSAAEGFEAMPGGAATSLKIPNRDAFSHFSANLTFAEEETFKLGNALFRKLWVSSPSSTLASDGLGPLFNARACQSCHLKDGRGHPPEIASDASTLILRLARQPVTEEERRAMEQYLKANFPDAVYGGQLQDHAVPGLEAEGQMEIAYAPQPVVLADGTIVSLRRPRYGVKDLAYGPLDPATTLSPRIAPPMLGMGLIQAIHPADIAALADPDDRDGDGISGRMALLREEEGGEIRLGRFGWKAEQPDVRSQVASAFSGDIGISSPLRPAPYGDCTEAQARCRAMPDGAQPQLGGTEAPDPVLDLVTFYSENLAPPARRDVGGPKVLAGKQLFYDLGCTACHRPKFVTRRDAANKAHAFQLIWPYSDLLLHDMGEGLADGQKVGVANGREWRTPPLWGIGLTETVSGHTFLLHDGRARDLTEAILWHGGEAQAARDGFAGLAREDREALIAFLESL